MCNMESTSHEVHGKTAFILLCFQAKLLKPVCLNLPVQKFSTDTDPGQSGLWCQFNIEWFLPAAHVINLAKSSHLIFSH